MADRLPQYPMPPNFTSNSLLQQQQQAHHQQQQQLQQQQQIQHQPQDPHSSMSHSAIDQARLWQQQMQFRAPSAADMNPANPAQFTEMMKRTHAARSQQQQQQQQFGMGSGLSQMNPVIGGSAQQPPFHDSSSPHPQPSHIPTGFPNMGGMPTGNPNQPQVRNPQNILQGFQTPLPGASRQLELMNMAQNQQPQNGPIKFNSQQLSQHQLNQLREQQQQHQFQSASMNPPADLFSSPAISNEALRRPSPHPANVQQPQNGLQGQQLPRGMMSLAEMTSRATIMRTQISQHEGAIHALQQQLNVARGTANEPLLIAKIKAAQEELVRRKEFQEKLLSAINVVKQKASANANNGGPSGQQPWISHPQSFDNNSNGRNPVAQPSSSQPNPIQTSPSLAHSQSQANHLVNQGFVPQRSGPTPQHAGQSVPQHPASPFNPMQQQSMGGQFPFSGNNQQQSAAGPSQPSQLAMASSQAGNVMNNFGNGPNLGMIPPLEKTRFEMMFKNWCIKRNLKLNERLLSIDSRPVEIYRLHVEVLKEGGFNKVDQKDIWSIIGGRLGFVQFPGTDTEPAKSGPGVAQQLAHIYKEYLALFDQWYTAQAIESHKRAMGVGNMQQAHIGSAMGGRWNPQQMQQVVQMSHMSVAELHAQGIDEKTIAFVETNRASLQRTYQEQKAFQNKMRTANLTQPGLANDPNGPRAPVMTTTGSFSAGSPAQHNTAAFRQQIFQQQQLLQAQQGLQQSQQSLIQGGQALLQGSRIPPQQQPQNIGPRLVSPEMIMKIKHDYTTSKIPAMQPVDVPAEHRLEFNQLLEQLFRQCSDAEQKLHMIYTVIKQEDVIRKLIAIICTIQSQRTMLATVSNPRYIITLETLKNMMSEMARITELFQNTFNAMRQRQIAINQMQSQGSQPPVPPQQQPNPMAPPMPVMGMPDVMSQPRPPVSHQLTMTAGSSTQQHPQLSSSSLRPPPVLQAPPVKRTTKASSNANAASTPSPAAAQSASTPAANAATPTATASSPPAAPAKSPKTRAPPKPKGTAASRRRPSKATPASAPTPDAAQPVASSSTPNGKRPREEDPLPANVDGSSGSITVANEPSPPKRAKTEWESPPTEAMKKKDEAVENIKTEEDATAYLVEQMTDFIKMAGGDGQSSLPTGITETLEMILKGYGTIPDSNDGASGAFMVGESSGVALKEATPPPAAMTDAFDEFFDFSLGTAEDDDSNSKAPTPDLVSSSSTNPSPESNHESDLSHHIFSSSGSSSTADIKTEEPMDPLRLGPWKNIDGGEGAYYQTHEWKWDSPMPSLDQPWAIFNS
ncbi:hypothetical protein CPB84DRAFT_1845101 [Gymnopilus junonius]|uniref:ARID domain-containing protein n=1 Tax=Gymnopilus junonius TaxID=109634 RepID=A0A9P5NTI4_GYMJU|nr:hypothetical protein CPB84DRAFT_1845101 [Gymnopilus junonius]